jgi:hypothetical protein
LLVLIVSWCRRSKLRSSNEVLGTFIDGDVEVHLLE